MNEELYNMFKDGKMSVMYSIDRKPRLLNTSVVNEYITKKIKNQLAQEIYDMAKKSTYANFKTWMQETFGVK